MIDDDDLEIIAVKRAISPSNAIVLILSAEHLPTYTRLILHGKKNQAENDLLKLAVKTLEFVLKESECKESES